MTLAELVAQVYIKATGKVSTLTSTDTKYQKILAIANQFISQWENTTGVDWSSLYEREHSIGTISATATYDLDDDIRKLSDTRGDYVQIASATDDDNRVHYDIVPADTLSRYGSGSKVCAQIGRTLVFRDAFTSDSPVYGGTIYAPIYLYAEPLASANDEVPVDIPQWLVIMTAAEYVRNDATKQNQYPNLVAEAGALLDRMIDDNDAQVNEAYIPFSPLGRSW